MCRSRKGVFGSRCKCKWKCKCRSRDSFSRRSFHDIAFDPNTSWFKSVSLSQWIPMGRSFGLRDPKVRNLNAFCCKDHNWPFRLNAELDSSERDSDVVIRAIYFPFLAMLLPSGHRSWHKHTMMWITSALSISSVGVAFLGIPVTPLREIQRRNWGNSCGYFWNMIIHTYIELLS